MPCSPHIYITVLSYGALLLLAISKNSFYYKKGPYVTLPTYPTHTQLLLYFLKYTSVKCIYEFRLLYSFFFSNEIYRASLENMCDLRMQRSDARTQGHERWLIPLRRTGYFLQSVKCTVPTLLNKYEIINTNRSGYTRKEMRQLFLNSP